MKQLYGNFGRKNKPDNYGLSSQEFNTTRQVFQRIAEGIIDASTQISSFDLRASYFAELITRITQRTREISHSLVAMAQQTSASMSEVAEATSHSTTSLMEIAQQSNTIVENINNSSQKLNQIMGKNEQAIQIARSMQEAVENLVQNWSRFVKQ